MFKFLFISLASFVQKLTKFFHACDGSLNKTPSFSPVGIKAESRPPPAFTDVKGGISHCAFSPGAF